MKKIKRLLPILVLIILAALLVASAVENGEYTGNIDIAKARLAAVVSQEKFDSKLAALDSLEQYLTGNPINPEISGYGEFISALDAERVKIYNQLLDASEEAEKLDDKLVALEKLAVRISTSSVDITAEIYEDFNSALSAERTKVAALLNPLLVASTKETVLELKIEAMDKLNRSLNKAPTEVKADAYSEFNAKLEAERASILRSLIALSEAKSTLSDKAAAMANVDSFMDGNPVDLSSDANKALASALINERFALAELYVSSVTDGGSTAQNGAYLRKASLLLTENPGFAELEKYENLKESYDLKCKSQAEAVKKAREELEKEAVKTDYFMQTVFSNSFDVAGTPFETRNTSDSDGTVNFTGVESAYDGVNAYYTVRYNTTLNAKHTFLLASGLSDQTQGFVVDFDITTFSQLPAGILKVELGGYDYPNGTTKGTVFFSIKPNGDIADGDGKNVYLSSAVTKGEWTHITLVWSSDYKVKLYVDYSLVAEFNSMYNNYERTVDHVRIGASSKTGEFSLDNFQYYSGTAPRDITYLSTIKKQNDEDALFLLYTQALADDRSEPMTLNEVYELATELLPKYFSGFDSDGKPMYKTNDQQLRDAVDVYNDFSYDEFLSDLKAKNSEKLYDLAEALSKYARDPKTYSDRTAQLVRIDSFISRYGKYLEVDDNYTAANDIINKAKLQIANEDTMSAFKKDVSKFFGTTSGDVVSELYVSLNAAVLAIADNADILTCMESRSFADVKEAYETYIAGREKHYSEVIEVSNTKEFLETMQLLGRYTTEEEWIENYELIDFFLVIARECLEKPHDQYYRGFKEAYSVFEPMNDYFYTNLQNKHKDYFADALARYDATEYYVAKYGIILEVEVYLRENEVELEFEGIKDSLLAFEERKGLLDGEYDKYEALVEAKTAEFLEIITELRTGNKTYTEKKALLTRADACALAMKRDSEAMVAAYDFYLEVGYELADIEKRTGDFIVAVSAISVQKRENAKFAATVRAMLLAEGADAGVDGAASAFAAYESALNEFEQKAQTVNSELSEPKEAITALLKVEPAKVERIFLANIK